MILKRDLYAHFNGLILALPAYLHVYIAYHGRNLEDCIIWYYLLNYVIEIIDNHGNAGLARDTTWVLLSATVSVLESLASYNLLLV